MRCHVRDQARCPGTRVGPVQVRLLGPVEVFGASGDVIALPGGKLRGLVAMLALEAGRTVPADRLMAGLWGEQDLSGPNVLQVLVSKLRRLLAEAGEPNCVSTQPAGYRLDIDAGATDVSRFETLLQLARVAGDDAVHVVQLLDEALGLWQGVALWGVPDTELTAAMRARLHELRNGAADELFEARLGLGQHDRVIPELEALLAEDPLREGRWGLRVRALYGSGRQAEAVRAVQRARQILIDQIGIEPGDE